MSRTRTQAPTASSAEREHPCRDAAEQRRAESGSLLDGGALEREPEHRRDDAQPELAPRPTARDAAGHRLDTELGEQLERVAQPEGDTLEHGPGEGAPVVAERKPRERTPRIRIGMRRSLSGEVGSEEKSLGARGPRGRVGEQLLVAGAEHIVQPAERAGRREHHAHRVPGVRDRMAERVQARLRVGGVRGQRREDDPGGAEHDGQASGAVDSDPERAGRLVAGATDLRALVGVRQPGGRQLEQLQQLAAPLAAPRRRRAASRRRRRRRSRAPR